MARLVMSAFVAIILFYLGIGFVYGLKVKGLGDILPLIRGRNARVNSHREFSASTVAATLSLATVVIAFYELVPSLGLWLLWTAFTTALGLLLFSLLARRIWNKMSTYTFRPTIHAYLGEEFGSKRLAMVASVFTSIGYLSAFAVELTVGSRFLAGLLPRVSPLVVVIIIAIVSFTYTGLGGFRVVVVTDRIQMWFMWMLITAMGLYYLTVASTQGWATSIGAVPQALRTLQWSNGLLPFLLGIAIMNILTYMSNMGLWQRIAGAQEPTVVVRGMWSSVLSAGASWSLLVIIAIGSFMVVSGVPGVF